MQGRRVVITGLGMVTPLGKNVDETWNNLIKGKSGISKITRFPIDETLEGISKIAGQVKYSDEVEGGFNPEEYIEKKDLRKMDRFIWYGIAAGMQAVEDSGWKPTDAKDLERTGVIIGSGIGGLTTIQETSKTVYERGMKKISPFFIPQCLINLASGHLSIKYGFYGPNLAPVTACATGSHAIGDAMEIIKRGDADVMVAGGTESAICEIGIGGFSAMHALSTAFNNEPERASRPWDKDRDGFVMGEGAGIMILEEYEHAKARGAKIYGEIVGYGISGDAYHMTSPHPQGEGAKRAIRMALQKAKLNSEAIDYVNAHGTSTSMGDVLEFNAVKEVFNSSLNSLNMSSTKSATGHLLGASGAIEAIFSTKVLTDGILPPTLNLDNQDEQCTGIDLVAKVAKEKQCKYVLSNSFGFGGTNACLIIKRM